MHDSVYKENAVKTLEIATAIPINGVVSLPPECAKVILEILKEQQDEIKQLRRQLDEAMLWR